MNVYSDTYITDILNVIAQGMLIPTLVLLIALIAVSVFFVGQIVVEYVCEHRHYKQNMPAIINALNDATYDNIVAIIADSKLLRFQKSALITVARNMGLPEEPLFALAQIEIGKAEKHYKSRMAWTDTISKIAPLMGLMATLIPLGPGIVALGQNDVTGLSQSLGVAFDATVCGLICAILALIVSKVRSGWYSSYIDSLESIMTCVMEKAALARKEGVQLPTNYAGDPLKDAEVVLKEQKKGSRVHGAKAARNAAPDMTFAADRDGE